MCIDTVHLWDRCIQYSRPIILEARCSQAQRFLFYLNGLLRYKECAYRRRHKLYLHNLCVYTFRLPCRLDLKHSLSVQNVLLVSLIYSNKNQLLCKQQYNQISHIQIRNKRYAVRFQIFMLFQNYI